jgi:acylglycerol lipase
MKPTIGTYRAPDGSPLHYRHWGAVGGAPKTRIVALHGIQSHSGWYGQSSARLASAGHEVWFLDRRGSGMNEASRGDVASHEVWLDDVIQFLSRLDETRKRADPSVPTILMAVSWGGKPAAMTAALRPDLVDGLALLYPGLCSRVRPRWWQLLQLSLADRLGIRTKRVPIPLDDPALFTGEESWQEFIRNDPLALRDVTVGFLLANQRLDRLLREIAPRIDRRLLLMLAGRDRIIDNAATRDLAGRFASSDRRIIEYPEACHTLEFEPAAGRFVDDLLEWLAEFDNRRQPEA